MRSIYKTIKSYVYDTSISLQDRSFVLFSSLVLIALYAAVPFGLIMREPVSATVSTLLGAIAFSVYVHYVIKKNKIAQAKIFLSIVVVVIFLPVMFFTNGGGSGGAPRCSDCRIVRVASECRAAIPGRSRSSHRARQ